MFRNRKYPRLSEEYHVVYKIVEQGQFDSNPVSSLAVNISGGGVCFVATEALEQETMVTLDISAGDLHSSILALAKVKWCKDKGEYYEIGAEIWSIGWRDDTAQRAMADFITTETTAEQMQDCLTS